METKFRPLTSEELAFVAGAKDEIYVTGHYYHGGWSGSQSYYVNGWDTNINDQSDGYSTYDPAPLDTALANSVVITVGHHNIYVPQSMTIEQQNAANAFINAVRALDANTGKVGDYGRLTVTEKWTDSSGQQHTLSIAQVGGDLKEHWASTSFALFSASDYNGTLNATGTNGTGRGSSNLGLDPNMTGNIIAGFNIDLVRDYFQGNGIAAMEYLALHEVAHYTAAGQIMNNATLDKNFNDFKADSSNYANENIANTIALATMAAMGLSFGAYDSVDTVFGGWQSWNYWTDLPPDSYDPGTGEWGDPRYPGISGDIP